MFTSPSVARAAKGSEVMDHSDIDPEELVRVCSLIAHRVRNLKLDSEADIQFQKDLIYDIAMIEALVFTDFAEAERRAFELPSKINLYTWHNVNSTFRAALRRGGIGDDIN
jgi:hypothetical protein